MPRRRFLLLGISLLIILGALVVVSSQPSAQAASAGTQERKASYAITVASSAISFLLLAGIGGASGRASLPRRPFQVQRQQPRQDLLRAYTVMDTSDCRCPG